MMVLVLFFVKANHDGHFLWLKRKIILNMRRRPLLNSSHHLRLVWILQFIWNIFNMNRLFITHLLICILFIYSVVKQKSCALSMLLILIGHGTTLVAEDATERWFIYSHKATLMLLYLSQRIQNFGVRFAKLLSPMSWQGLWFNFCYAFVSFSKYY